MHKFASKSAFIDSPCDTIAESDQNAFAQRFVGHRVLTCIQTLLGRDSQKLIMKRTHLPSGYAMDSDLSNCVHLKPILRGEFPCTNQNPEIGSVFLFPAQYILAGF